MSTISNENILMMFEEINQKLDNTVRKIENIGQIKSDKTDNGQIEELKSTIENFQETQSNKLENLKTLIQKEKRKIEFTPTSTFGMVFFLSMMLIVLALSIWVYTLKTQNATLTDNDLKFRYIQMQGNANSEYFAGLDTIFHYNRNNKKIKMLRKQVETFEENVKQRARILEQEERLKKKKYDIEKRLRVE